MFMVVNGRRQRQCDKYGKLHSLYLFHYLVLSSQVHTEAVLREFWSYRPTLVFKLIRIFSDSDGGGGGGWGFRECSAGLLFGREVRCAVKFRGDLALDGSLLVFPERGLPFT